MTFAGWRPQLRAAALVVAVLTLLGAPAGLIWAAVAPRLQLVMTSSGLDLLNSESQALISDDGDFLLLTAALGVLTGLAVYRATHRDWGVGPLLGLAAGGLSASAVAATVGERVYRGDFQAASRSARKVGDHVQLFVSVRAEAVLFGWSFAAVAVYLLAVLLFEPAHTSAAAPSGG